VFLAQYCTGKILKDSEKQKDLRYFEIAPIHLK
jgi:hypothetical protein